MSLAVTQLPEGSILLITIDTEPPSDLSSGTKHTKYNFSAEVCRNYFESIAQDYIMPNKGNKDFEYDQLPKINLRAIKSAIQASATSTSRKKFQLLFNFIYADGHRMITVGGMLLNAAQKRRLKRSRLMKTEYVRKSFEELPFRIAVPCLTRKEQIYLDENMPLEEGWNPEFELSLEEVAEYSKIYRFFPTYAELFL